MKLSLRRWSVLIGATGALWVSSSIAEISKLPDRENPRPETTNSIPHIQIDVEVVPEISADLLHQMSQVSGVDLRSTVVGRSGSTGFWLDENIKLARPDAIIRGREFAHLHPDGSLHASLPQELAATAVEAGWATPHPWAAQKPGLEGFVMLYTPRTKDELIVVFQLLMESYKFVTGKGTASTGE